ncbi:MFS general substrate transporter [Aureobasidium subglaciale]|nr:MFS general substrate transporter [Aureobasidium subglaciale]
MGQPQSHSVGVKRDANGTPVLRRLRRKLADRSLRPNTGARQGRDHAIGSGGVATNRGKPPYSRNKIKSPVLTRYVTEDLRTPDYIETPSSEQRDGHFGTTNPPPNWPLREPNSISQASVRIQNQPPMVETMDRLIRDYQGAFPSREEQSRALRQDTLRRLPVGHESSLYVQPKPVKAFGHVPGAFPDQDEPTVINAARVSDVTQLPTMPLDGPEHAASWEALADADFTLPYVKESIRSQPGPNVQKEAEHNVNSRPEDSKILDWWVVDTPRRQNMPQDVSDLSSRNSATSKNRVDSFRNEREPSKGLDRPSKSSDASIEPPYSLNASLPEASFWRGKVSLKDAIQQAKDHMVALETLHKIELEANETQIKQEEEDRAVAFLIQEEENRRRAAGSQPKFRDCTVCCDSFHPLTFPAKPPSSDCTHRSEVCPACLQAWVDTKIKDNARRAIACPQCTKILSHHDIRRACDPETFDRYDKFAMLTVVDEIRDFHWCLRSGCTGGQEVLDVNQNYMQCHACDYEQCLHHKMAWHVSETCEQYDERLANQDDKKLRDDEERKTIRYMIEQQAAKGRRRECPKCKNVIPKGKQIPKNCPITCGNRACQQKFCWICLVTWEKMLKDKCKAHAEYCILVIESSGVHGKFKMPDESIVLQTRSASQQESRNSGNDGSVVEHPPLRHINSNSFAMSYGIFQEYFIEHWTLQGSQSLTGIIGMTSNGVMYLSMPFLFALFTKRWARYRQTAALCGTLLACLSFVLSSFSTNVWHLVATQGVLAAFGSALVFSPMTLSLGEWYKTSNRALAYGITLSCKNIVGSVCPFLFSALLDRRGFRFTLRIWAIMIAGTSVFTILLIPTHSSALLVAMDGTTEEQDGGMAPLPIRSRKIPWHFLHHRTIYIYSVAIMLQSAGYGIPQTYLNTYASEVALLSQTSATLLLTLFNIPGIASSSFFGYLSDNKRFTLSATTVTCVSGLSSALSAFLLWGLNTQGSLVTLVLFAITFGFFAGGYSATWGGLINDLESEARSSNEAIDSGMVYGLLNGARGLGYVAGGLIGVPLLKAGAEKYGRLTSGDFGVQSSYGPLILFTGLASVFGGWGVLWKWKNLRM